MSPSQLYRDRIISLGAIVIGLLVIVLAVKGSIIAVAAAALIPFVLVLAGKLAVSSRTVIVFAIIYAFCSGPILMALAGVPIGIAMDAAIVLAFVGFVMRQYRLNDFSVFRSQVAIVILVWMTYHILELGNPYAASRTAWFYVMRPAVFYPMLFFLMQAERGDVAFFSRIKRWIIALSVFSALWGLVQFLFGYFPFEMNVIIQNDAVHLVYINGRWRTFGTLVSPAQFGVTMAFMLFLFLMWSVSAKTAFKKILFLFAAGLAGSGMIYSGTRSAMVVLPLALAVLVVLNRSKKLIGFSLAGAAFFAVLMVMPTNNYHISRMQSAFKTEEDASFNVRAENRARIFPYIVSHPFGGGLGSTGVWGMRFSPGTMLSGFAPDAGYLRVAVELGWVGLILYLTLWIMVLVHAIKTWLSEAPGSVYKTFGLAVIPALASLVVVEWAQDIVGKLPFNMLFWILAGMVVRPFQLPEHKSEVV